ncbi:1,4-alpha-glucan branching enzyme [subsurface metagenome]
MEGIAWLKKVFELVSESENIGMTTISDYVSKFEAEFSIIKMGQSSWGEGGYYQVWRNKEHIWIWSYINSSIIEFEKILEANPNPDEWGKRIFKQMAREILLMQGSDWPFLLYTKRAKDYANQRFHNHHQRFNKLLWAAKDLKDKTRISIQELEAIETIDTCFQDININYFKKIH